MDSAFPEIDYQTCLSSFTAMTAPTAVEEEFEFPAIAVLDVLEDDEAVDAFVGDSPQLSSDPNETSGSPQLSPTPVTAREGELGDAHSVGNICFYG